MIPEKRKKQATRCWSKHDWAVRGGVTFICCKTRKFQRRDKEKLTDWPFEALFVLQGCCPHIWELCFQEPIHPSCDRNIKESSKDEKKSFGEALHSGHTAHTAIVGPLPQWGLHVGLHSLAILWRSKTLLLTPAVDTAWFTLTLKGVVDPPYDSNSLLNVIAPCDM